MIEYYLYYAYCCRHMDFQVIRTVMEIGSGVGKQVEVLRKLHPHLCFYLFDIPPQLYVCQQYLSTVFPGSVVGYRETCRISELPVPAEGKIFIFPTWKLPEIKNPGWDMHWNGSSYQEMEADQASNYLTFVNRWSSKYVYLIEKMEGQPQASRPGEHGVLSPTRFEHYQSGLPDFKPVDMSATVDVTLRQVGDCTFWKRVRP